MSIENHSLGEWFKRNLWRKGREKSRGIFFNVESSRVCRNVLNFRLFRYPPEYDAQAAPKPPNSIPQIRKKLRQHRTIPALRLKHRSGSCGTASALPKCSIMSGCGIRIVLRGQKPLALCDRCPCFGSLFPPLAALTFAASSIICAFGLAAAAPRSPYRYLELCGIAFIISALIGCKTAKRAAALTGCGPTYYFMRCGY